MLKVGVAQIVNSIKVGENLSKIISCIEQFQKSECDLVIFPECALTGFTSLIKDTDFSIVSLALKDIQTKVDMGTTSVFVPTGWPASEKRYFNSAFYFTPHERPAQFYKEGLTASESGFFESKVNFTRTIHVKDYRVGYLFCIEAAQETWKYLSQSEKPDLILWPSYWRNEKIPLWNDQLEKDGIKVFKNSEIWRAPLVHTTFSKNHEDFSISGEKHS